MTSTFTKIINAIGTLSFLFFGIIFIFASTADPSNNMSYLLTGIVLVVLGIIFFAVFSLLIERRKYKVVKILRNKKGEIQEKKYIPQEIVCPNCKKPLFIDENMKEQDSIVCERCGEPISLKDFDVNW